MTAAEFIQRFDEEGRYRTGTGREDVVFVSRGRRRHRGRLHFRGGLCVRAEMEGGGDWSYPDESPLNAIRFLLQFDEDQPLATAVAQGRMVFGQSRAGEASKKEFLVNFRVARNLFAHPQVVMASGGGDPAAVERKLVRSALWLTPKSVAGFNAEDFRELGPDRRRELDAAVQAFREVAGQVPANAPATEEQFHKGAGAFTRLLEILAPYVPVADEARKVEAALAAVNKELAEWVLNWDYELGSDADGLPAVWVDVFADERGSPLSQLGGYVAGWTAKMRESLMAAGIDRWPYVRVRTGREHKALA